MTKNPILDELHSVRERLLAEAGGTLDALVDRLQAEERHSSRAVWIPKHDEPRLTPGSPTAHVRDGESNPATG